MDTFPTFKKAINKFIPKLVIFARIDIDKVSFYRFNILSFFHKRIKNQHYCNGLLLKTNDA